MRFEKWDESTLYATDQGYMHIIGNPQHALTTGAFVQHIRDCYAEIERLTAENAALRERDSTHGYFMTWTERDKEKLEIQTLQAENAGLRDSLTDCVQWLRAEFTAADDFSEKSAIGKSITKAESLLRGTNG